MKAILLSLFGLIVMTSACSFHSDNNENSAYQKQKEKLETSFEPIIGTYEGNMTLIDAPNAEDDNGNGGQASSFPLQLGIYTELVSAGKDSQGQDQILPTLKIRYRQMDAIRADEILSARFINETGDLTAASATSNSSGGSSSGGSPSSEIKTTTNVRAVLRGNHLIGEVTRASGRLGKFDLVLVSRDVLSQSDAQKELYDRMVKMNRSLQGVYLGNMKTEPNRPEKKDFPVRLELMAVETVQDGIVTSKLMGYYTRPDFTADPTAGERTLTIDYRFDKDPPQFVMSSSGGTTQIPNAYFMSLTGSIKNGVFKGDAYDRRGYIGVLTVKKVSR